MSLFSRNFWKNTFACVLLKEKPDCIKIIISCFIIIIIIICDFFSPHTNGSQTFLNQTIIAGERAGGIPSFASAELQSI